MSSHYYTYTARSLKNVCYTWVPWRCSRRGAIQIHVYLSLPYVMSISGKGRWRLPAGE